MTNKERLDAAYKLLDQNSTTIERFNSVRGLIKGINPTFDKHLEEASKALATLAKLQEGEVIELTTENLPENTEEQKKRKKFLLLFIKYWKQLKSEIKRVKMEIEKMEDGPPAGESKVEGGSRIAAAAKGPFGIVTIIAVVAVLFFANKQSEKPKQNNLAIPTISTILPSKTTIKALEFQGKRIPLSELALRSGPDCDAPHYHALNHVSVKTIDGETIQDPGACAFGREKEVKVIEVSQ